MEFIYLYILPQCIIPFFVHFTILFVLFGVAISFEIKNKKLVKKINNKEIYNEIKNVAKKQTVSKVLYRIIFVIIILDVLCAVLLMPQKRAEEFNIINIFGNALYEIFFVNTILCMFGTIANLVFIRETYIYNYINKSLKAHTNV